MVEENIALERINVRNMALKNTMGMESDFNLQQARERLRLHESNLDSIESALAGARTSLNQFLGFSPNRDIFIEYDVTFNRVSSNVERHIALRFPDDPNLAIERRRVEHLEYIRDTTDHVMGESILRLDNDLAAARRNYSDMVNRFSRNIYTAWNNLRQIEERRNSLEIDLNLARNNYNQAVTNFEAGRITMFEVQQLKVQLLSIEIALIRNQFEYDNLRFAYDRPYLL